jgi:regulator of sirC expression with transglutaminase-like and TPR domain
MSSHATGWSPASGRQELEGRLRRYGSIEDATIDLADAALLLAALDRPRVSLARYHHHLADLARDATEAAAEDPGDGSLLWRIDILNQTLRARHGYEGDELTYDDLQNANLMRVIDRRKGLPVALAVLYLHTARAQGWAIEGLNFPGHFLLRLERDGARAILDPFRGTMVPGSAALRELLKASLGAAAELHPQHTAPLGNRGILLRLQNNIKLRLIEQQRPQDALEILGSMLMLAPRDAALWREAGILHGHVENLRAALFAFEQVLDLADVEPLRHEAAGFIQKIRAKMN